MLKTILLIAAAAIAVLLIYAALKPNTFALSRSVSIAAPSNTVFALINDLRQFNTWNPFAKLEPAGVGGAYNWQANKSGAGRMQITESPAPQRIAAKLDFSKPFEAHKLIDFTVQSQDDKTSTVTVVRPRAHNLHRLQTRQRAL